MIQTIVTLRGIGLLHDALPSGTVELNRITVIYAENERILFCGFEKDRLLKWTKCAKEEGDFAYIILPGDRGRVVYTMKRGVSTEGEWSLFVSAGTDKPPNLKGTPGFSNYPR